MTEKELTPEQKEAFLKAIKEAKRNTADIIMSHIFILCILAFLNGLVFKHVESQPAFRFFMYFMTSILIVCSCNKELIVESDRFSEESRKIINQ